MQPEYLSIEDMIEFIAEPNRLACRKFWENNLSLFIATPGSSYTHQAWPGGYIDHVQEVMNLAILLHGAMRSSGRHMPDLSDALLVLFLHDSEKPWKYGCDLKGRLYFEKTTKEENAISRKKKLIYYGIILTPEQENAMKYIEGEGNDYSSKKRVQGELAAFCHMADIASARIWYNYPKTEFDEDPWKPALRNG